MNELLELEKQLADAQTEQERLGALLSLVGHHANDDFVDGWQLGQEALDLALQLQDKEAEAKAYEGIANCLWKLAHYSESLEHYEKSLDINSSLGDRYGMARCYCGMGIISGINEDFSIALERFEQALTACRAAQNVNLAMTVTGNIGHINFKLGRYNEANKCFETAMKHHKETRNYQGVGDMLMGMAGVHVYQGEFERGLELARRGIESHRKIKHQRGIGIGMMNVGVAHQKMGNLEMAKTEFLKALNYCKSINLRMSYSEILKRLSEVCTALNQPEESTKYFEEYMATENEEKRTELKAQTELINRFQRVKSLREKN